MRRMSVFSRFIRLVPVFILFAFLSWMFLPDVPFVDINNPGLHSVPDYDDLCDERTPAFIFKLIGVLNAVHYDKSLVGEIRLLNMGLRAIEAELRANGVTADVPPLPEDVSVARGQYIFEGCFMTARRELFLIHPEWKKSPDLGLAIGKRLLRELGSSHVKLNPPRGYAHYGQVFDLGVMEYERLGLLVARRHEASVSCVYVDRVAPGSPAEEAGFKRFDLFLSPSGLSFIRSLEELWKIIGGRRASDIQVARAGTGQVFSLHLPGVDSFDENPCEMFAETRVVGDRKLLVTSFHWFGGGVLSQMLDEIHEENPDGLVLDFRNSMGGHLGVIDLFFEIFLPDGTMTYKELYDREVVSSGKVSSPCEPLGLPVVVLVNEHTRCGGELAAQVLMEKKRARVVGMKTCGQVETVSFREEDLVPISTQTSLTVAAGSIKTASGTVLEGRGVVPEFYADISFDDIGAGRDPQLDRALEVLLEEVSK